MRIKDYTDMVRHLTDPFNIPEARRMIAENPALTQEQFKAGGIVEPGVTHYAKKSFIRNPEGINQWVMRTDEEIQKIIDNSKYEGWTKKDFRNKEILTRVETEREGLKFQHYGKKKDPTKVRKAQTKRTDWIKEWSNYTTEQKLAAMRKSGLELSHIGGKADLVTLNNLAYLPKYTNKLSYHRFEKILNGIQADQNKILADTTMSVADQRTALAELAKADRTLRNRFKGLGFDKIKSRIKTREFAWGMGKKEVIIDPSITIGKGEAGANIPLKTASKTEKGKMVALGKENLKALQDAEIPCKKGVGGQCNSVADYRKGFNELVQKGAAGDKTAVSKLQKFTNIMKKAKGPLKWTGYGLLAEAGFMVPFAAADYAAGESWKRILGNATDWGFGPMFGQSEDEEIIANLPEGSLGAETEIAKAAHEREEALTDPQRNFPKGRIGMDPKRFQEAQTKVIEDASLDLRNKLDPFMEGPRDEYFNTDLALQSMEEWKAAQEQIKLDKLRRIKEREERGIIPPPDWYMGLDTRGYREGGIASLKKK